MKILYVTPHLSTGGLPQYLTKKIESLIDEHKIHVVEYNNISRDFVVQRNKILNLIGKNLITLDQFTHHQLSSYVQNHGFDIVHFEEFSESFIDSEILKNIYSSNRTYKIFESTHSSNEQKKVFLPDAFVFVSQAHIEMYAKYNVPSHIVEYPIEKKQKSPRTEALSRLGLDPGKKHVLNVGLFTPGKNQGEIFEYAKHLPDYQFHFVGNQAGNFEFYWGDLMKNKPDNCIVWGERNDVELFYDAADIFLFTSKLELSPLVIREAIAWDLPIFMYNLPIYYNGFDKYENITYLTNDISTNINLISSKEIDHLKEIVLITAFVNNEEREVALNNLVDTLNNMNYDIILTSHCPIPQYILNKVKYNVIDDNNEKDILYRKDFKEYNITNIRYDVNADRRIEYTFAFNHGYAVWTLWKNALSELVNLHYEKVHVIDFDTVLTNNKLLLEHSNNLNGNDMVLYHGDKWFVSSVFSFRMTESVLALFNSINSKQEFYSHPSHSVALENILYHMVKNMNIKHVQFERDHIYRYGTQLDTIYCGAIKSELSTENMKIDFYPYDQNYDILRVSDSTIPVVVDEIVFDPTTFEKLYLISKKETHTLRYNENGEEFEKIVDMDHIATFNKIEVYNKKILINTTNSNKKELVVITAYPDTEEKERLLINCIDQSKNMGYDVMISSHYNIPERIVNMVEYCVLDLTDNLLYRDDYEKYNIFLELYNVNQNRKLRKVPLYNHGYAVWKLWENACKEIDQLDYLNIHMIDYDTDITSPEYLIRHSELLNEHDFVAYKSDDYYNDDRYVTNLFSFRKNGSSDVFNFFKDKDSYFSNKFGTTLLEDIFFKIVTDTGKKVHVFNNTEINSFNTRVNLICGDNSTTNELSTDKYVINLYKYNDNYDILYLAHCNQSILIDDNSYINSGDEKLFLIPNKSEHKIDDGFDIRIIDMVNHCKYNKIEVYNTNMLIPYYQPKIRIIHMVTAPNDNTREQESIRNILKFATSFENINYYMQVSEPYKQLPPVENCAYPDWIAMEPGHQKLSPGHYGCYLAHKNAISLQDNEEFDMIIIFEGDAIIETEYTKLYNDLLRWKNVADQEHIDLVGFGNVFFDGQAKQIDDLYVDVRTFIPAHSYFITKKSIKTVLNAYNNTKWHATDLWMTEISGLKKAITNSVHAKQLPGYSLIDKKMKNKENDLNQIYSD